MKNIDAYCKSGRFCANCGELIDKKHKNLEIRGLVDGYLMPWPVCKKCWDDHYNGYKNNRGIK